MNLLFPAGPAVMLGAACSKLSYASHGEMQGLLLHCSETAWIKAYSFPRSIVSLNSMHMYVCVHTKLLSYRNKP